MSLIRIDKPNPRTSVIVMNRPQLFVRLTTKNFEEATMARREGRRPSFQD